MQGRGLQLLLEEMHASVARARAVAVHDDAESELQEHADALEAAAHRLMHTTQVRFLHLHCVVLCMAWSGEARLDWVRPRQ